RFYFLLLEGDQRFIFGLNHRVLESVHTGGIEHLQIVDRYLAKFFTGGSNGFLQRIQLADGAGGINTEFIIEGSASLFAEGGHFITDALKPRRQAGGYCLHIAFRIFGGRPNITGSRSRFLCPFFRFATSALSGFAKLFLPPDELL